MWFVLLSGRARVWTPGAKSEGLEALEIEEKKGQEVWINASGERSNQIVLALDLDGRGHKTWYYGEEGSEVAALQIPLAEGWEEEIRYWELVNEGPC